MLGLLQFEEERVGGAIELVLIVHVDDGVGEL